MRLHPKYYRMIADGIKTVELRLYDKKRQAIQVGDTIRFENRDDANDSVLTTVTNLTQAESFKQLFKKIPKGSAGTDDAETLLNALRLWYPESKEAQHGVLGIHVSRL